MLKGLSAYFASELMCMDYITTSVRTVQDLILFAEPRLHLHFLPVIGYWPVTKIYLSQKPTSGRIQFQFGSMLTMISILFIGLRLPLYVLCYFH